MNKLKITFLLPEDVYEKLRKLSFVSRISQGDLIAEGLELLFKTAPRSEELKRNI